MHELTGTSITLRQTDSIAYWDHAGQRLYTVAQKPNSVLALRVADLLARQFVEPEDYKLASIMILNALLLPADELAKYIDSQNWHMPRQEQRWLHEILDTWPTRVTAVDGKAVVDEPKETHRDVHTPALGGHSSVQDTAAIGDAAYDGDPSAHTDELHKTKENQEATATTGQDNYAHAASIAVRREYKRSINVRTFQQRLRARKPRPRIDVYLSTSYDEDADWGGRTAASFAQAAVDWVISLEHAEGWEVADENDTYPNHPGWDLTARRTVAGAEGNGQDTDEPAYSIQEIKYIEVNPSKVNGMSGVSA